MTDTTPATGDDWTLEKATERFLSEARAGRDPSVDQFADEYPEHAAEIRELFPMLRKLERIAPSALAPHFVELQKAGRMLAHYRLVRLIGKGGMAEVYEAEDTRIDRLVAVKVIDHRTASLSIRQRFQNEAKAAGRLHHTNIVPIYDAGEDQDCAYIAMQLIDGCSLSDVISCIESRGGTGWMPANPSDENKSDDLITNRDGPADTATDRIISMSDRDGTDRSTDGFINNVVRIGRQISDAIAYSHSQAVLHRDIKPANVLLSTSGQAWVSDFGLAKSQGDQLTASGDLVGTLSYMAPEQLQGRCDERSDLYSIGATLFCLLTGSPPSHAALKQDSNHDLVGKLKAVGIPADLVAVIAKSLATRPDERYQSVAKLSDELGRFLAGDNVHARRRRPTEQIFRWTKRNPAFAGVCVLLLLLLIAAAISSTVVSTRLKSQQIDLLASQSNLQTRRDELLVQKEKLAALNEALQLQFETDSRESLVRGWSRTIEAMPDTYMAYKSRGEIYINELMKFDLALADFERAVELMENVEKTPWAHLDSARSHLAWLLVHGDRRTRDYPRAIELAEELSEKCPEWWTLHILGYAYYHTGQYREAEDALARALADIGDEPHPLMHYYLAMSQFQNGNTQLARQTMLTAEAEMEHNGDPDAAHPFWIEARNKAIQLFNTKTRPVAVTGHLRSD